MPAPAERVGEGPCPHCKTRTVTFKRSSGQKLRFNCDGCASSGYADPGGSEHGKWMASVKPFDAPGAEPIKLPNLNNHPDPAPPFKTKKQSSSVFDLGQLA